MKFGNFAPYRTRSIRLAALVSAIACGWAVPGLAQPGGPLDFRAPQLALVTGGHHAPIRSLIFTADGRQLLSGGQDKVILVWDLMQDPPVVVRTIRPPVYRGYAGTIYAMALSPPDADGQSVLAVAGFGVNSSRGNILLYRYPGVENRPTGEILGELPGDVNGVNGHADSVMAVAFSPDGNRLATAGNDGTVRLWDHDARRLLGTIPARLRENGAPHPLNALAYPTADRLAGGGDDGALRVWRIAEAGDGVDLGLVAERPYFQPRGEAPPDDYAKNLLTLGAARDDGGWSFYAGHESGQLVRFDGLDEIAPRRLLAPINVRGNVGPLESLAVRSDGKGLAFAQIRSALARKGDLPTLITDAFTSDGRAEAATRIETRDNIIYAMAYGPDDRWLAVAGGDDQAIRVYDLRAGTPPRILKGRGRSVWNVGWRADGQAVGYSGDRRDAAAYACFDLAGRTVADSAAGGTLRKTVPTWNNWRVTPTGPWTLDLIDPTGRRHPITLDRSAERRWWSYSFVPPVPNGHGPVLAVGCEAGVLIFRLDPREASPRRLHSLAGHSGPVYAIAPSPDGRLLATGSSNQTVRIWSLREIDRPAPLGAEFRRDAEGGLVVAKVASGGHAERAGLKAEDRVLKSYINKADVTADEFLKQADAAEPGRWVEMVVGRGGREDRIDVGTTKRDSPLLSLFVPDDRQWIAWTPEGYYDTSIEGDARHLGWHRNGAAATEPTQFYLAEVFEGPLRRKDMLNWTIANASRPPAPAAAMLETEAPPIVRFVEPAGAVGETLRVRGPLRVSVRVERAALDRLARLEFFRGSQPIPVPDAALDPDADEATRTIDLDLNPGFQLVTARATNASGRTAAESIAVYFDPPPVPVARSLAAVAFGPASFPARIPPIKEAAAGAQAVGDFLDRPAGKPRFEKREKVVRIRPEETTARAFLDVLDRLVAMKDREELRAGDTVLLDLESHFYADPKTKIRWILGSDAQVGPQAKGVVRVEEITARLAGLVDYGCRVMLLLDLRHKETPKAWLGDRALDEWVRDLRKARVIVFLASDLGPSEPLNRTGAFADGIVRSLDARGLRERTGPISLREFARNVIDRVQDTTGRRQSPYCSIPATIDPRSPILDPQPPDPPAGAPVLARSAPAAEDEE